jgi:Tol biopolymer transport system component
MHAADIPQIFIVNADGSQDRQITDMPEGACQPSWSPDGTRLVFISPCLHPADTYPAAELYTINGDGTNLTPLPGSQAGDFDPAWSPDGNRIAFTSLRSGTMQIYVMSLKDYTVQDLTGPASNNQLPNWSRYPAWSPSGTQILYTGHSLLTNTMQIWVMNDSGNGKNLLIHQGDVYSDSQPNWSYDENLIVFSETSGTTVGWLMSFDYQSRASAYAQPIKDAFYSVEPNLSPDGNWLAFSSTTDGVIYHIYLETLGGQERHRLTDDQSNEFDPVWRPVGAP